MKFSPKMLVVCCFLLGLQLSFILYPVQGENNNADDLTIVIQTSMGKITIQLRDDMPITVGNFLNLLNGGVYDNTIFHRVVNLPNNLVMIQGGDPTGTGYGDPSIPNISDEFSENPENNKNLRGTIAMANTGQPNSGSSQFFINGEYNGHLDNHHPVFGDVVDGMDVVDAILNVETDSNGRPIVDITLNSAQTVPEFSSVAIMSICLILIVVVIITRKKLDLIKKGNL